MVHIITDSTSDLTVQEAEQLNIRLIHMRVIFEDGVYTDGVDITKEEFYAKQAEAKVLPKTTQLNPQEYCDAFRPLLENGDEVVAILVSSKLSGSFQSACIAKEMLEGGERLHLVDSLNATLGEGLLVREAARLRDAGKTAAEIAAELEALRGRVRFIAFVGTLKYLKMGGRISASTARGEGRGQGPGQSEDPGLHSGFRQGVSRGYPLSCGIRSLPLPGDYGSLPG